MEFVLDRSGQSSNGGAATGGDTIVRLRGLPWQCTKDDVQNFFQGMRSSLVYASLIVILPSRR